MPPLDRPNVLWVVMDDISPWMSCYGDATVETPNFQLIADTGVCFERAYSTAPVCTPARSAVITGMYQTTIGAHHHYSSFEEWRGKRMDSWEPNHLGCRTIPELFKSAGYYTFNEGKNHYNFVDRNDMLFDRKGSDSAFQGAENGTEWSGKDGDQPFFGQIQLEGGKVTVRDDISRVDPESVSVPPYYPDVPVYREEIAHHYDTIQEMDQQLGEIIEALRNDGLYEETVIWVFSDHGMRLPRHKQFLYEGGIRIPVLVRGPGLPQDSRRSGLVSGIDIGPTSLATANLEIPQHMHGRNALAESFHREYIIAARDRCDYTIDRIRAVVTDRYKYIRNFMTDRPYLQPQYRDETPALQTLKQLYDQGELDENAARFVSPDRPAEELYDLEEDPHETANLVHSTDREHQTVLAELRSILHRWIIETDDQGRYPESDAALKAVLERWGDEAVDPVYDRVREDPSS